MANPEHVAILKQGVKVWNAWRREDKWQTRPDLSGLDFSGLEMEEAPLAYTILAGCKFNSVKFQDPNFEGSILHDVEFGDAFIEGANFQMADLEQATFNHAHLIASQFHLAKLAKVSFDFADLSFVNFQSCEVVDARFNKATLSEARFLECELVRPVGLRATISNRPCFIDSLTLQRSHSLPDHFLQLAGLSDLNIEHYKLMQPGLTNEQISNITYRMFNIRATQAIQINPLFVSYSHADTAFVDLIGAMLTDKGVRYWRDIHHATAGKLEKQVDRAMRLNPTVLIVLSEASVNSDWVEHEVESARELEKSTGRDSLCPIALDNSWKNCDWDKRIMRQLKKYNILDFSEWQDEQVLERQFSKLLHGLDLFYG